MLTVKPPQVGAKRALQIDAVGKHHKAGLADTAAHGSGS